MPPRIIAATKGAVRLVAGGPPRHAATRLEAFVMDFTYSRWRSQLQMTVDRINRAESACGEADWLDGPPDYVRDQLQAAMSDLAVAVALLIWRRRNGGGS